MNKSKSFILLHRVDGRTKVPIGLEIKGIKVVPKAKYLGLVIDDDLSFKSESLLIK